MFLFIGIIIGVIALMVGAWYIEGRIEEKEKQYHKNVNREVHKILNPPGSKPYPHTKGNNDV